MENEIASGPDFGAARANLRGRKVLIVGLGRFGGGIGVTRWLVRQGATVTVTDLADADALRSSLAQLADLPVAYRLGGHHLDDLDQTDLLVINPAVDQRRCALVQEARVRNIPSTSEMEFFLARCRAPVVGVTGSAGKSTTCAMIHEVTRVAAERGEAGIARSWLGGNIGGSLLDDLDTIAADDSVILELSSFQLEDLAGLRRSPSVAVLTNLTPNHLDRHGSVEAYLDAKLNIVRHQRPGDVCILGDVDDDVCEAVRRTVARAASTLRRAPTDLPEALRWSVIPRVAGGRGAMRRRCANEISHAQTSTAVASEAVPAVELRVPGVHNRLNACCAAMVGRVLDLSVSTIVAGLERFSGLPHRLQHVATLNGVAYINDSKATTPEQTVTALHTMEQPTVLIVGGQDKGLPLTTLATTAHHRCRATVCVGQARGRLAHALRVVPGGADSAIIETALTLAEGFARARRLARPGDAVLLSPGGASFDEFANFEERGKAFERLVRTGGTDPGC